MTKPFLRLRSLLFHRGSLADGPGCVPVRASRFAPVPAVDWFRDDRMLSSGALAFPVVLGRQAALPLHAEFDVIEPSGGPLFLRALPRASRLLGQVFSTPVPAAAPGGTLVMDLELKGHGLLGAAVGRHELVWSWQHSEDERSWDDFDETAHTVFTLLDHPAAPWGGPGDPRTVVPWRETLQTACGWAKGVRGPQAAMNRITKNIGGLGGKQIGDDTLDYVGGGSVVWKNIFFISAFMKAVNGETDAPGAMNCADLASAVALFAAQIGCRSRPLHLMPKAPPSCGPLRTNRIRLFGEPRASKEDFSFHEVAQLGEEPVVWDACVLVDFDDHPEKKPARLGLPIGVTLDGDRESGDIGYLARLLHPSHRDCGRAVPACGGIRYPDAVPQGVPEKCDHIAKARRRSYVKEMRKMLRSQPTSAALNGDFDHWLESETIEHAFARPVNSGSRTFRFSPIRLQNGAGKPGARVSVLRPPTWSESIDIFLGLLTGYARPLRRARSLGDFAMYGERDDTIYMLRGGVIAVIHGGRAGARAALAAARALDRRLSDYFAVPAST